MREGKSIIIKGKKLKNIRNNLRKVIEMAAMEEWRRLSKEFDLIWFWQDGIARKPSIQEKAHGRYYQKKREEIKRALYWSICCCYICHSSKDDMILTPSLGGWVCLKCHKKYKAKQEYMELFQIGPDYV